MWEGLTFLQRADTFLAPGSWCDDASSTPTDRIYIEIYNYTYYVHTVPLCIVSVYMYIVRN